MNVPRAPQASIALLALALAPSCIFSVSRGAPPPPASREPMLHMSDQAALGPYSGSVQASGLVFVSGKIGARGEGFATEVHGAIDAVARELRRVGLDLGDVVSVTVYLTDMERYADLNAIYAARFPEPHPARACVAVAALPAGASVELQVIAARR